MCVCAFIRRHYTNVSVASSVVGVPERVVVLHDDDEDAASVVVVAALSLDDSE